VEHDGRALLGIRQKDPGRGDLVIPGGGVEPFETIDQAGIREIRDETSLDIEITGRIGTYELLNRKTNTHKVIVYSRARIVGGSLNAQTDISDLRFFSKEELASLSLSALIRNVLVDAGWLQTGNSATELQHVGESDE
jgi:8-oxo-dGTP diphosphatase